MADLGLTPSRQQLARVETRIRRALSEGNFSGLEVLGYGEISTVVALDTPGGRFAVKRLPPFGDRPRYEAFRRLFTEYLGRLADAGVEPVPSALEPLSGDDGRVVAYCVQPILARDRLGPRLLARSDDASARRIFDRVFDRIAAAVTPRLGLDGQLANWARDGGDWLYLDVTTPLLRDAEGRDLIDAGLFLAMLPWALRGLVRRFLLRAITDVYFDLRHAFLDLLANLHKERLADRVELGVEAANRRLERPITVREVAAHYARDARLWALLLRLRRLDRAWQLRVRRREYPYLLPGRIER